jgi:hypothetical protein
MTAPRTDKAECAAIKIFGIAVTDEGLVTADFARTLERELASALERERRLREALVKTHEFISEYRTPVNPIAFARFVVKADEIFRQNLAALSTPAPDHFPGVTKMVPWQPIETAPKDGSQVLLWFPSRHQGKGGMSWGCFIGGEWLDANARRDNSATLWMPLPPAPKEGE